MHQHNYSARRERRSAASSHERRRDSCSTHLQLQFRGPRVKFSNSPLQFLGVLGAHAYNRGAWGRGARACRRQQQEETHLRRISGGSRALTVDIAQVRFSQPLRLTQPQLSRQWHKIVMFIVLVWKALRETRSLAGHSRNVRWLGQQPRTVFVTLRLPCGQCTGRSPKTC